ECAVAIVAIEHLIAVIGNEQIDGAVVVVVAGADALPPSASAHARLLSDVHECAVAAVSIQMAPRRGVAGRGFETGAVDEKNVGPAVVVVIQDRDASAGGFEDVVLGVFAADDRARGQTGGGGQV